MQETFIHYIWRYRRMEEAVLYTSQREPIQIIHPGAYNTNAGPDFLQAKLKIGDTLWAGTVEMHIKASDWRKHGHQYDAAYQNVVLHVVWEEDEPITLPNGANLPCLELKPITTPALFQSYKKLAYNQQKIPCQDQLSDFPSIKFKLWLDRLVVDRLEQKTNYWAQQLSIQHNDWESVFYQALASNLGLPVNKEAMERLARITPLLMLQKHRDQLLPIEALLFGQAGMLQGDFKETYPQRLQQEYNFLCKKYELQSMETVNWKYARMRPSHFPSLRIAQLARLIFQSEHLFSKILVVKSPEDVYRMLDVKVSNYWKHHYRLDQISTKSSDKTIGKNTIDLIIINTIIPFLFLYGKLRDLPVFKDRAMDLLALVKSENNKIIREWGNRGIASENAFDSQGLLHLYKHYCSQKRCLDCAVGVELLK
ncbi:MAG: DUF2851 family protein [Bacteroidota bacterium]